MVQWQLCNSIVRTGACHRATCKRLCTICTALPAATLQSIEKDDDSEQSPCRCKSTAGPFIQRLLFVASPIRAPLSTLRDPPLGTSNSRVCFGLHLGRVQSCLSTIITIHLVLFATHLLTQPDPAYRPYHCTLIRPPRHRLSASYPSRPSYPRPAYFISDIVEQGRHPPPHILGTQHFITAYSHCDPNLGHAHPVSPFCVLCIASQPQVSRPSISTRRPPAMQQ